MTDRHKIEDTAAALLVSQGIAGEYALSMLDYRRLKTRGKATIGSYGEYARLTGNPLPDGADGCTVCFGGNVFILYNDAVKSRGRIFWTVAHELGHVYLSHKDDGRASEIEADRFAAALLMPEAVIRYLDDRLGREMTPGEMEMFFCGSKTAMKKRRSEVRSSEPYMFSKRENALIKRMFHPETANVK